MASHKEDNSKYVIDNSKYVIISLVILFLLVVGLAGVIIYTNDVMKNDYNAKLDLVAQALITANKNTNDKINTINNNINSLNEVITDQSNIFTEAIQKIDTENKANIDKLTDKISISQSQNQKNLNLLKDELQSDIKNVQISGSDFSGLIEELIKSIVSVLTNTGQGSGAFVTSDGHVITNDHVISSASVIRIKTYDNKLYNAQLIGTDPNSDIAVLKIANSTYPKLKFEDNRNLKVGEKVIALGNPGGLDFSVTEGIISALNRVSSNGFSYVQTDVPINPGNSGGPLINTKGRIVGINNFKFQGFEGVGFALNSETSREISEEIIGRFG